MQEKKFFFLLKSSKIAGNELVQRTEQLIVAHGERIKQTGRSVVVVLAGIVFFTFCSFSKLPEVHSVPG